MSSHELNSTMVLVHPPLAIAGQVFVFLFALVLFLSRDKKRRSIRVVGLAAWFFTLLGLVTGMVWAQVAWGSYWSWDPKETLTLLLFVAVSAMLMSYYENKMRLTKRLSVVSCVLVVITASSSFIMAGLHSFV